jgi:hypothetical protein
VKILSNGINSKEKKRLETAIRSDIQENIEELKKIIDPKAVTLITNLIELEIRKYLNAYGLDR